MKWGLVIASRATRHYHRVPAPDRPAVDAAFSEMRENPFSGDVKILRGSDGLRRRVRDWRILYKLDQENHVIVVTAIKRRGSNTY
jgi:mRNA-degrading endonuclease RelE of RelBE toxin-antitoxin system